MEGLGEKDLANIFQQVADRRALADTGLASTESMGKLIKEGVALKDAWKGMSAMERGEKLLSLVNARLRELKIPEMVRFQFPDRGDGFFVWTSWTLQFNENILKDASRFDWLLEAAQHEARHAEQVFSVARLKAPTMAADTMVKPVAEGGLGIPRSVAEAAHAAGPIEKASAEGREAERWFESMMGGGRKDRKAVYDALDNAENALKFAEEQLKADRVNNLADVPRRERQVTEKWRDYQRAVGNYKGLVEEADAYAVQAKFNEELRNYYQLLHDAQPATVRPGLNVRQGQ
jgi:hypothetical protein